MSRSSKNNSMANIDDLPLTSYTKKIHIEPPLSPVSFPASTPLLTPTYLAPSLQPEPITPDLSSDDVMETLHTPVQPLIVDSGIEDVPTLNLEDRNRIILPETQLIDDSQTQIALNLEETFTHESPIRPPVDLLFNKKGKTKSEVKQAIEDNINIAYVPQTSPTYPSSDPSLTSESLNPCSIPSGVEDALQKPIEQNVVDPELVSSSPWKEKNSYKPIYPLETITEKPKDTGHVPNPQTPNKEMQVLEEAMTEGFLKYGLPISVVAMAGTFLMRRRYRLFKSTPFENVILSALHYYGALSIGLYAGLNLYGPEFEAKIMEQIPESGVARAIREKRKM